MIETAIPCERGWIMAPFAGWCKTGGGMVGGSGLLVVRAVASDTGHRQAEVLQPAAGAVAGVTRDRGMTSYEGETGCLMLLHHVRHMPGRGTVAADARCPKFARMDVAVAAGTVRSCVGEDE